MRFYGYKGCDSCRKAKKWLASQDIEFEDIPIREQPPSKAELKKMLKYLDGQIKRLFNTSGQDYRKLGIKDKLTNMSQDEALDLLSQNGNLVKRPFVLTKNTGTVGFREDEWKTRY